ncbi:SMI1/KNR4 family protein [Streptomyces hainanensis]|uniref:Knr4/Smi1-like domain-containing protein n=1 Tax=Streptomyces hainanensis TaxID=402648 RepID=A0A4R4TUJ7_9ACTN|nr:SMI1/KNR4 family protein [Streptomyces hainanensis]TDC80486.1 hypothetical protein E1283_00010 [Streptomyces hainanensis]
MSAIEDLSRIMPPHDGAGDEIDWDRAERTWGVAFPADYREFVGAYGEGVIEDFLALLIPYSSRFNHDHYGMAYETGNAREAWRATRAGEEPQGVERSSLIAWGVDSGADILCWGAVSPDPNEWPVVVYRRQGRDPWRVYRCGMVEFLLKTIRGDLEGCPLSGDDIWECDNPRFLHWREEARIVEAGEIPWLY